MRSGLSSNGWLKGEATSLVVAWLTKAGCLSHSNLMLEAWNFLGDWLVFTLEAEEACSDAAKRMQQCRGSNGVDALALKHQGKQNKQIHFLHVPPTFRVGLLTSNNPIKKVPQRCGTSLPFIDSRSTQVDSQKLPSHNITCLCAGLYVLAFFEYTRQRVSALDRRWIIGLEWWISFTFAKWFQILQLSCIFTHPQIYLLAIFSVSKSYLIYIPCILS